VSNNPGTSAALVNGIANNDANIKALVLGGSTYPIARKLFLNTLQGFEALHNSDATVASTDAEEEMTKCFGSLLFPGAAATPAINVDSTTLGFVKLPPPSGASKEVALCQDFNGTAICGDATNSDACIGNDAIATGGGFIPTSFCNNGLQDGAETAPDVCQSGTTCNATTHHCQ
jgi:hypothetical protein